MPGESSRTAPASSSARCVPGDQVDGVDHHRNGRPASTNGAITSRLRSASVPDAKRPPTTPLNSGCGRPDRYVVTSPCSSFSNRGTVAITPRKASRLSSTGAMRVSRAGTTRARYGFAGPCGAFLVDSAHAPGDRPVERAVVTGGARGIGRGIAERMVARGHRVVITDVDGEGAARTAAEIGAAAGLAHDVRDAAGHAAAAEEAARHGVLTAWFNNAGVGDDGTLSELSEEAVRRLVEVNLLGTLWGMRAAIAAFGERGRRHRQHRVARRARAGAGLQRVRRHQGRDRLRDRCRATPRRRSRVRVHALCPDGVQTAMLDGADAGRARQPARCTPAAGSSPSTRSRDEAVGLLGSRRVVRAVPGLARGTGPGLGPRAVGGEAGDAAVRRPGAARDRARAAAEPRHRPQRFEHLFA